MKDSFLRVSLISIKEEVANPKLNMDNILDILSNLKSDIACFSELCLTSSSSKDLFNHQELLDENNYQISRLLKSNPFSGIILLGGIFKKDSNLYNVTYCIKENEILGIVPKSNLSLNEKRWFSDDINNEKVIFNSKKVPFGRLLFKLNNSKYNFRFGIAEEDSLYSPLSILTHYFYNGVNTIFMPCASFETLGKEDIRENALINESRRFKSAILYVGGSNSDSTTNSLISSNLIHSFNGEIVKKDNDFTSSNKVLTTIVDLAELNHVKRNSNSSIIKLLNFKTVEFNLSSFKEDYGVNPHPFYLKEDDVKALNKVLNIQAYGIIKRINHINSKRVVLGVSGGLDSTMSLLALVQVSKILNKNKDEFILPVFLPYENSTNRTKNNQKRLVEALGLKALSIDISSQVDKLLQDINHKEKDVTYENAQVRVRTQTLMELANKYNGIVIGTSDLSEIAMGYSTYNGDSMSMYNPNSTLPKTMLRSLVKIYANNTSNEDLKEVLLDIVDTPVSAELNVGQLTEVELGKYEHIDFILYRFIKCGNTKEEITSLLMDSFKLDYAFSKAQVEKFFKRFYSQGYKRNICPDGLKVLDISLDPFDGFLMVSDVRR